MHKAAISVATIERGAKYRSRNLSTSSLTWLQKYDVQGADLEQGPRQDPDGEESGQVT